MTTPVAGAPVVRPEVVAGALPMFKPAATDEIVTIGDRTGIFTPLTGKGVDNTDNLSKIVDVLRGELAEARSTVASLQAKVDELTSPPRSADNLAEGVQNALDSLSDRLATMTNTTSNFAVREFTLESKVHVDVTPVGTIGFQFVKPGEVVNAAALSTVTLTVVPIPKPVPDVVDGSPTAPAVRARRRAADRPGAGRGEGEGPVRVGHPRHSDPGAPEVCDRDGSVRAGRAIGPRRQPLAPEARGRSCMGRRRRISGGTARPR